MTHSPELKALLWNIRQHVAFKELIAAVEAPRMPRYRRSAKTTLEQMGADTVFASGQSDQHNRWLTLLTGTPHDGEQDTSNRSE